MNILKKTVISFAVAAALFIFALPSMEAKAASSLLSFGTSGSQVTELQRDLRTLGYFTYKENTGYYGDITRDSVKKFQAAFGLNVDGIVGPKTMAKINDVLKANSISKYIVKPGDTLYLISQKYGMTVYQLMALNGVNGTLIYPGQVLNVKTASQSTGTGSTASTQNPDLYWLSRIIEAEAKGESYTGKVAVGSVIMNRVESPDFPDTVKGVVFEYFQGIPQFTPVADGSIYNTPSADSIKAAKAAISGAKPVGSATYFFNPNTATATWIENNKIYVTRIGNHVFYK